MGGSGWGDLSGARDGRRGKEKMIGLPQREAGLWHLHPQVWGFNPQWLSSSSTSPSTVAGVYPAVQPLSQSGAAASRCCVHFAGEPLRRATIPVIPRGVTSRGFNLSGPVAPPPRRRPAYAGVESGCLPRLATSQAVSSCRGFTSNNTWLAREADGPSAVPAAGRCTTAGSAPAAHCGRRWPCGP